MNPGKFARISVLFLCFAVLSHANDIAKFAEGAPPVPPGYATAQDVMKDLLAGKVKLIKPPAEPPATIKVTKDVEYDKVGGDSLLLDLYEPVEVKKPVPALVFIHGGGWKKGNKADYAVYCIDFAERGYVAVTINYRMIPDDLFPAAVEDCKAAVRWLRANAEKLNIDPSRIAAIGGSAGGHLSMLIGYSDDDTFNGKGESGAESSRVQAVVNLYGVPDLTGPLAANSGECKGFIGKTQAEAPDLYAQASPVTYLSKDDPPTLNFHGTIDELVPVAETEVLHQKLDALGIPNAFDKVEGWPHTMDAATPINVRTQYIMGKFLDTYLSLPK